MNNMSFAERKALLQKAIDELTEYSEYSLFVLKDEGIQQYTRATPHAEYEIASTALASLGQEAAELMGHERFENRPDGLSDNDTLRLFGIVSVLTRGYVTQDKAARIAAQGALAAVNRALEHGVDQPKQGAQFHA